MEEQKEITVFIVDDHQILREQLRKFINEQENLKVVGEAPNGEEAIKIVHEISPDVVLMDVNLSVMNDIEAIKKITSIMPEVIVIGLSLHNSRDVIESNAYGWCLGLVRKEEAFEELCTTIKKEVVEKRPSEFKR